MENVTYSDGISLSIDKRYFDLDGNGTKETLYAPTEMNIMLDPNISFSVEFYDKKSLERLDERESNYDEQSNLNSINLSVKELLLYEKYMLYFYPETTMVNGEITENNSYYLDLSISVTLKEEVSIYVSQTIGQDFSQGSYVVDLTYDCKYGFYDELYVKIYHNNHSYYENIIKNNQNIFKRKIRTEYLKFTNPNNDICISVYGICNGTDYKRECNVSYGGNNSPVKYKDGLYDEYSRVNYYTLKLINIQYMKCYNKYYLGAYIHFRTYMIYNVEQFLNIHRLVTEEYECIEDYVNSDCDPEYILHKKLYTSFYLLKDLVLNDKYMDTIHAVYEGTFFGNGYVIEGLNIEDVSSNYEIENIGLFSINNGNIFNLEFRNVTLNSNITGMSSCNIGILCGTNKGTIENVVFNGCIINCQDMICSGYVGIGVGFNNGTLYNLNAFSNCVINTTKKIANKSGNKAYGK